MELFQPLPHGFTKQPELIDDLPKPLSSGSFVAAFTGAHGLANGLDAVLDAAAVLQRKGRSDINLLFIGDGRSKPALESRVASEALRNCFFLPPIPKPQLAKILRKSVHVGLMVLDDVPAFYRGTSPNKFFDYLACGLPVVNNYPGWVAELIREHELGIPIPPRDPEAFAEALIRLADQPALAALLGSNARTLAESQFPQRLLADQWSQVMKSLLPATTTADIICSQFIRYLRACRSLGCTFSSLVAFTSVVLGGFAGATAPRIPHFVSTTAPRLSRQSLLVVEVSYYARLTRP